MLLVVCDPMSSECHGNLHIHLDKTQIDFLMYQGELRYELPCYEVSVKVTLDDYIRKQLLSSWKQDGD